MTNVREDPLLEVKDLRVQFTTEFGVVKAVDGVDLSIRRGETLCVVGESGCGKSITARSILRIMQPGRIVGGEITWRGPNTAGERGEGAVDIAGLDDDAKRMRTIRGEDIAMVFQEPMTAMSPVHTIGNQITEAILLHKDVSKANARARAIELLGHVGLPSPSRTIDRYPFELSGGMLQRAVIAMALSCDPRLLIADEPTTALDVTTQAQILELLRRLQDEFDMAMMFITHDIGVVAEMAETVAVMYLGKVVEYADVDSIFYAPKHPYTRALLRSIPRLGTARHQRLASIHGMVPDPYNRPPGCPFSNRCDDFMPDTCDVATPANLEVERGHLVRCFLYDSATEEAELSQEGAGVGSRTTPGATP